MSIEGFFQGIGDHIRQARDSAMQWVRREVQTAVATHRLRRLDVDGDGQLSRGELYDSGIPVLAKRYMDSKSFEFGDSRTFSITNFALPGGREEETMTTPARRFTTNDVPIRNETGLQETAHRLWPEVDVAKLFARVFPRGVETLKLSEVCALNPELECQRTPDGRVQVNRADTRDHQSI